MRLCHSAVVCKLSAGKKNNYQCENKKRRQGNFCSKRKELKGRKTVVRKEIKILRISHRSDTRTKICRKSFKHNNMKSRKLNPSENQKCNRYKGQKGNIIRNKHRREKDQISQKKIKRPSGFTKP